MFNFRPPNTRLPGFRVGLPDDEELGFNVEDNGSVPPVLPAVPDVATVDENYPYGPMPAGFFPLQRLSPNPAAPFGNGSLPPVLPGAPDVPTVDDNYPFGTTPFNFFARQGLRPGPDAPFGNGSLPPVLPGAAHVPTADDNYPYGTTSPGIFAPQRLSPNPAVPFGYGSASPQADGQLLPDQTAAAGAMQPDPRDDGGAFNYARYVPENPISQTESAAEPPDPVQKTSGGGLDVIGSAQAQTPQAQQPGTALKRDRSPGEAVVLPNGSTIPDKTSPTGNLMSPTPDLSAVAAAGQQVGLTYRAMLSNPQTAGGAFPYLVAQLGLNVAHWGKFDYQRRGNIFTGGVHLTQFAHVSNFNVGLFSQQAGLTLEETLWTAGKFACNWSGNAKPGEPYCLNPEDQLQYITAGYKAGQSGMFDPPASP
jgi:hypothetical protein